MFQFSCDSRDLVGVSVLLGGQGLALEAAGRSPDCVYCLLGDRARSVSWLSVPSTDEEKTSPYSW